MLSGCLLRLLLGESMTGSDDCAQCPRLGCAKGSESAVGAAAKPAVFCGSAGTDHICSDVTDFRLHPAQYLNLLSVESILQHACLDLRCHDLAGTVPWLRLE
jgi:hypothetical protein